MKPRSAHRRLLGAGTQILYGTLSLLCLALLLAISAPQARSATMGAEDKPATRLNEVEGGSLLFRTDTGGIYDVAPTVDTDVHMDISGTIARVTVKQAFFNDSPDWREAIYAFPLPDNAAVDRMRLRVGDRLIEGQIKEKRKARKTYEKARAEGRQAGLVEQQRPNMFTTSVANIAPNSRIAVEIEYQQTVRVDNGRFDLRFPLVIGPRYIPRPRLIAAEDFTVVVDPVPDAADITPPVRSEAEGLGNPVTLTIRLDRKVPLGDIASPSHAIAVDDEGAAWKTVTLAHGDVPADRDFVLQWSPAPGEGPAPALYSETKDGHRHVLLSLMPRPAAAGTTLSPPPARSIVFVIDTSGSMHGESLRQAKAALILALGRLRPEDSFNVIQFNSVTSSLFRAPRRADASTLNAAKRYVANLESTGGTEMLTALTAALESFAANDETLHQVVFLTDGSVGNERELFGRTKALIGDTRLFTVGIGSAPNSYFMTRAAQFGRGSYTFISTPTEVSEKMNVLLRKLERPVLTDLQVIWPDGSNPETWPTRVPDLYDGQPLTLAARFQENTVLDGQQVMVTGRFDGRPWQAAVPLAMSDTDNPGIAAVWARRKIAALMDSVIEGADFEAVKRHVTDTALDYKLVSKYTSLVAVDVTPVRPAAEPVHASRLATNLPHGWSRGKVLGAAQQGYVLPRGATPAAMHLAWALAMTMLAGILFVLYRRRSA